jgi:hypothetical protein
LRCCGRTLVSLLLFPILPLISAVHCKFTASYTGERAPSAGRCPVTMGVVFCPPISTSASASTSAPTSAPASVSSISVPVPLS